MRVLLVVPHLPAGGGTLAPHLGIVTLAALTPSDIEVSVVDENVEKINFDEKVDVVGISAMTPTITRAYEISDSFRQRDVPVVMGGFHPSFMPEEAIQHCDSVVIGEAETIWPNLLRDIESRKLKRFYKRKNFEDLENLPFPRRDLLNRKSYTMFNTVETSRGCPFHCSYCSVSAFFGNTHRSRPIKDVITEVETLKGILIFFVDDNIVGMPRRAKNLFRALIPYKRKWIGQASLTIARDTELLELAARSGCAGLFIGFESLSQESLEEAGKKINAVKRYAEDIKRIHNHGISIHGAFIFGFDHDDEGVFERTVDFVKQQRIDSASFSALTPFPGTPVYDKLLNENRLITKDWSRYSAAVFKPKLMSLEKLNEGCAWAWKECYSYSSILRRLAKPKRLWFIHLLLNLGYKQAVDQYI
ncbi:MAG: radical SAM protein [candidate division WOR-3 bacterium]|jgi:radical SAM superfamily enzyme YgiQ (UPF0313 family)